jgi:6,7-dimethyl-8-ribityllumazine synthase
VSIEHVDVAWVPGAFEIRWWLPGWRGPALRCGDLSRARSVARRRTSSSARRGRTRIAQVGVETGVPVIFEVLATDDLGQAESRAGGAHGNKGWEAAEAALEMAWLLDRLPDEEGGRR